jgi:cytochrome c biogenesis protein CcmG/thiol:disulfide interchange protein DsbE
MEAVADDAETAADTVPPAPARRRLVWLVLVLGCLVALFALLAVGLQPRTSTQLQGNPAPEFQMTAFNGDFVGRPFSSADLRGQVVVLNMWASWCVECETEAAVLEQAWQDYRGRGVWFVGVDYLDTDTAGMEYLRRFNVTYPNGPDIGSRIYQSFRCTGVPETFFIDRDGVVQHVQIGPISQPELAGLLDRMLVAVPYASPGEGD